MGGRQYSREAIHKRLLDYDSGDISKKSIDNDPELPRARTICREDNLYVGKNKQHITSVNHLKDFVANDHLQVWQGDDESIERAVEQAVEEIGEKPERSNLEPYFRDYERFPSYPTLFTSKTQRYSGGLSDLKPKLEVTEENLRAYSDKDEHIEETMLYAHNQLGKEAPTQDELEEFLQNHPKLLGFEAYRSRYGDKFNALFEKHGKKVNPGGGENDPIPLSDQDERLLWGMMLGDGCCKPGRGEKGNPWIVYGSTDKPQLTVLKERTNADIWTNNIYSEEQLESKNFHYIRTNKLPNLEQFRKPYRTVLNGSADPNSFWTTWDGLTGETFAYSTWKMMDMSKRMKSKKARIPEGLEVSPELMMAWYLGDGSRHKRNDKPIITAEFPREDYQRIQSQLEEKVFDDLKHPENASSINEIKGSWSLTPLNPDYLQPGAQLGYTNHEEQRIIDEAPKGELQREVGKPLRTDMIIDRKTLKINKTGAEAFFDYLPDRDDWDNVMPRKFPS